MIHCLRVQRRFNSPIYHEAAPSNSNGNGHGHTMTCQPLNNEELLYIRQLNRIYGTVAAVGIAVGLWTLTASLLPVRRIGHTVTSSMLSNIAFNCFYSTNGSYRMLWSSDKRLSPPKMMTEQQHPWSTSNSIYLPKATSHCSDILESVHSMEMRSPSPMKPPPIAYQRNDRHHHYQQQLYHTNSTATTTDHDYSRTSITSATSYTHYDDQTGKRVFIEGRGPRVSAVGTHNNGFLTVGTYNEERLVNNASEYMSPRGSFSSGDGRGYIIEMYSVEESAYIEREITDSCDSRV
ncbi:hypothetical protein BDF19DRAFT_455760 [Syncephalis fuscata]|nr:hypothetical protein BDF19DRAFT_455760 [Syncephalis fuscata]